MSKDTDNEYFFGSPSIKKNGYDFYNKNTYTKDIDKDWKNWAKIEKVNNLPIDSGEDLATNMVRLKEQEDKLERQRKQLAKEAKELEKYRQTLEQEAIKLAEEKARVEKEVARLEALKRELHDKKYEASDLAEILETPPPTH